MRKKDKKKATKTVLITGASGGIGEAIAIQFARNRWNIIGHYFSSGKKVKELAKSITDNFGVDCHLFKADFSSETHIRNFISVIKKYDIDSLVNNAATPMVSRHFSELAIRDITKTFMINAIAPMLVSSKIFMHMKKKRFGRIVNISSIAAKYGGSNYSMHYGSSKLALEGLTKTLAKDGARYNVFVNTIRPGVINTGFYKKFPKNMKERIAMIPAGKMGSSEDIAKMVYYLGSEENNFITNEIITIAGGE